ncbi:MAG: hypothetical protein IJL43_00465 [Lachnospiraceae bacterium]|nr:hypothetical protein [Lachnospiraceae bacterium]
MRLVDADDWEPYFYEHCDDAGMIGAKNALDEMPTIDAVPVVRCKDCEHHLDEEPGMVYCPDRVGGWVSEDFFCKDGTPKKPKKKQIPTAMIVFEGEAIVELYADKKKIIEALKKLEEEADE